MKTTSITAMMLALCTTASADELLHWTLDDAGGAAVREAATGARDVAVAIGAVGRRAAPLAPDGGYAMHFVSDDPSSFVDAGSLDETGAYVPGSSPAFTKLDGDWSLSAWFELDEDLPGGDLVIASSDFSSKDGWLLGVRNGKLFFDFGSSRQTGQEVETGVPYFVALCVDVGSGTSRFELFDGTEFTTVDVDKTIQPRMQGLEIGAFGGQRQFQGAIDDVRIHAGALFPVQLQRFVSAPIDTAPDALGDDALTNAFDGKLRLRSSSLAQSGDKALKLKEDAELVIVETDGRLRAELRIGAGGGPAPISALASDVLLEGHGDDASFVLQSIDGSDPAITIVGRVRSAKSGKVTLKARVLMRSGEGAEVAEGTLTAKSVTL